MSAIKRACCDHCHFLVEQCVCQWIPELAANLEILILQDSKEAKHAKNTLPLLCLGLPKVRCVSTQDQVALQKVLSQLDTSEWYLIFPCDDAIAIESVANSPVSHIKGIILLDATWRKAKKMYWIEPLLHAFTAVRFTQPPAGKYVIRKSPNAESLSTLEACAYAIEQISGGNMQPLREFMIKAQEWQWRLQPSGHRHYS